MDTEPIVQIEQLTKRFGSFTAVDNLNLTVGCGEIFGLLGPNGAGKSTLIKMLTMPTGLAFMTAKRNVPR